MRQREGDTGIHREREEKKRRGEGRGDDEEEGEINDVVEVGEEGEERGRRNKKKGQHHFALARRLDVISSGCMLALKLKEGSSTVKSAQ